MAGEEIIPGVGDGGVAVADGAADDAVIDDAAAAGDGASAGDPEAGADADAAADPNAETAAEGDLSDIETDGRKIDAATRAQIAELKKTNPQAAKRWAESYFRNQAVMKEFPEAKTPGEAISQIRTMKATIDELGGEAGITELRGEVDDYRNEVKQFSDGDPNLIRTLGEANPEGLARQGTNTLEWLKANKPDLYESTLRPSFMERFEKVGFGNLLTQLKTFVKDGKGEECWKLLQGADEWLAGEKEKITSAKTAVTAKNPEAEKLAKDRADFEETKKAEFVQRVDADVNRSNNPELDKYINPLQKELGLKKEGMQHFRNGLVSRVWSVLAKDPAYLKQVRTLRGKGDAVKTAEFIHSEFKTRLPEQFRLHRNEIYPNIGSAKKAAAPAANGGKPAAKPINIAQGQRPRREDVDWGRTSDAMWITGRAVLTNGKTVSGFKDAPANR